MHHIHARLALLPDGWAQDTRVEIESTRIASVSAETSPQPTDERVDVLIPGMPNLHSHAFQRALAGLTEVSGDTEDSFWTWREAMYRIALSMSPEQVEIVAALAYMEMLEAGFTRVGEFHYLHHDVDGRPYADIGEMAARIAAAASNTGIALTLLPVFYAHSGFGGQPPHAEQRRFINNLDTYARILERSHELAGELQNTTVGIVPHSLRAVTSEELTRLFDMQPVGPAHIHVAEQLREVDECLAWSGKRPVELLMDTVDIDERWCLIHATHMTSREVERLAASGAVAGLCPVTEANLGDGIFSGTEYVRGNGRYGIGTDSNIAIDAADELRQLEYSQRLRHHARNVMATEGATGRALFDAARSGGSIALGTPRDGIAHGAPADLVALGSELLDSDDGDRFLNAWVFTQSVSVRDVWVAGSHVVQDGLHTDHERIVADFRTAMRHLAST